MTWVTEQTLQMNFFGLKDVLMFCVLSKTCLCDANWWLLSSGSAPKRQ
jgi:hypothetical protein